MVTVLVKGGINFPKPVDWGDGVSIPLTLAFLQVFCKKVCLLGAWRELLSHQCLPLFFHVGALVNSSK